MLMQNVGGTNKEYYGIFDTVLANYRKTHNLTQRPILRPFGCSSRHSFLNSKFVSSGAAMLKNYDVFWLCSVKLR